MALGLNKILISSSITTSPGAYWQLTSIAATTAGNVIPAGTYLAFATANVTISAVSAINATSNAVTWSALYPVNTGGVVISDGVNVCANASTNATMILATVNGGQAASGTFNS